MKHFVLLLTILTAGTASASCWPAPVESMATMGLAGPCTYGVLVGAVVLTGEADGLDNATLVVLDREDQEISVIGALPDDGPWNLTWNATLPDGIYQVARRDGPGLYREMLPTFVGIPEVRPVSGGILQWRSDYRDGGHTVETSTFRIGMSGEFTSPIRPQGVRFEASIDGVLIGDQTVWSEGTEISRLGLPGPIHWDARGQVGLHTLDGTLVFFEGTAAETRLPLPPIEFEVLAAPPGHPSEREIEAAFWDPSEEDPEPMVAPPVAVAGVGLIAAAALASTEAGRWGMSFLFTRLRSDSLLDQRTRRRIHAAVAAQPGIHLRALRRRLGIGNGTMIHHLRILQQAGIIDAHRRANRVRLTLRGDRPATEVTRREAEVLRLLGGPLTTKRLAAQMGTSRQAVHRHVQNLWAKGLVTRAPDGAWVAAPLMKRA